MLYELTLTPLTPIHIGCGDAIEPYEYIITDRLYKFSPEGFISILDKGEQDEFLRLSLTDILAMREFIRQRAQRLLRVQEYSFEVSPSASRVYEDRLKNPGSDLSISTFIRTQGTPYIPGSSLKGAIRTAILYERVKKPVTERDARRIEAETFGYARERDGIYQGTDITRDPFKWLKISDSQRVNNSTILRLVTVYTKGKQGWREDVPLLREVTHSQILDNPSLSFIHTLQVVQEPLRKDAVIGIRDIIRSCRDFYSLHLREEGRYLSSFPDANRWYQRLHNIEASLSENTCLVRLGWGSGFDGVTINYARASMERKRSRRLSEDGIPLGWAVMAITQK